MSLEDYSEFIFTPGLDVKNNGVMPHNRITQRSPCKEFDPRVSKMKGHMNLDDGNSEPTAHTH